MRDSTMKVLREIARGKSIFLPISSDVAIALGLPEHDGLSEHEAAQLESDLRQLDAAGYIRILSRSAAGAITVDGITALGIRVLEA